MNREGRDEIFLLEKLYRLTGVEIVIWEDGQMTGLGEIKIGNPLMENQNFREELCWKADVQQYPVVFRDEHQVIFSAVRRGNAYCLAGPMNLSRKSRIEWHRYYKELQGKRVMQPPLPPQMRRKQ